MAVIIIMRAKFKDYATWRPFFDGNKSNRAAAGLTNERVFRSADDKNEITIIFDDMDTKKAKDFASSQDLKDTMMKAGVVGKPTVYFLETI